MRSKNEISIRNAIKNYICSQVVAFCLQMHSISAFVYRCTVYQLLFTDAQYISFCLQMHSISAFVYRCTVYQLLFTDAQYICLYVAVKEHLVSYVVL